MISGAAGDIALEAAKTLQGDGCNLVLTDIDAEELAEARGTLGEAVVTVAADLSTQAGAD